MGTDSTRGATGTDGGHDPAVEHERTRAALADVNARLVRLLGDVPDPDAPSGLPGWSVGDAGAHLAAAHLAFCSIVTDEPMDWDALLPAGAPTFAARIRDLNATSIALFGPEERARLGEVVAERGATFLRATRGLAPDTPVLAPWYGEGAELTLATATGLLLSESLVHGLDIARGARLPWRIGPDEARLVLGQAMPTVMPLALDPVRARGVDLAFDLALTGGPRLAVVVADGRATVTRDAPPRRYDCRITADPATFLLVSFRRTPIWRAVALGRLRAGGRRPWLTSGPGPTSPSGRNRAR
ncbi:maleylpyruvate isomerase family mycothiol-dependent enzyme [Streptomyces sp. NPDC014779]|uniref:maleylpyruvate isomerase family mycothiol-dependent enzyme n=1 Tax=Streptomyces sp. NPDC014779 TaxID=3364911 RepID=UPI003703611E